MKYISLSLPDIGGGTRTITPPVGVPTGGIGNTGTDLIQLIISLLFVFGIILALLSIMYTGIQFILSRGEKQALENSRKRLIFSIIGLIVIFIAFLIINLIFGFIGKDLFTTKTAPTTIVPVGPTIVPVGPTNTPTPTPFVCEAPRYLECKISKGGGNLRDLTWEKVGIDTKYNYIVERCAIDAAGIRSCRELDPTSGNKMQLFLTIPNTVKYEFKVRLQQCRNTWSDTAICTTTP